MPRILLLLLAPVLFGASTALAQPSDPNLEDVEPLLPPGISDFNLEVYGRFAHLWQTADQTNVVEVLGNFSARMGQYKLTSRDAVIWFKTVRWRDRKYIEAEIFLWQGAEILQPGGTVETGPALLATLRTFGKPILNLDSSTRQSDEDSGLYREGLKARRLLDLAPPATADDAEAPVAVPPSIDRLALMRSKPRRMVNYRADQLYHEKHGDQSVVITMGNVFLSQGSPSVSGEYLELRAEAAVLYLQADQIGGEIPGFADRGDEKPSSRPVSANGDLDAVPETVSPQDERKLSGAKSQPPTMQKWVSAVYLEGDVVLSRGQRMIRASKLYYDFEQDKALILDVVTRALEPSRSLPIYVRAEKVRQLDQVTYQAENAEISTSEFHTPHVSLGAREVTFQDVTPRNERGEMIGIQAGTYKARHTTLNVDGDSLAYWPFASGKFSRDRSAFKRATFGYNSDFGGRFETQWYLFNLLGMQEPEGFDATLKLDYFTERGPAAGIDMDYQRDDYFGLVRSYFIHDDDEDDLGPTRGGPPDHETRGRFLLRHRHFLADGWQLSLETSYISDDQYLESYERNEFENAKQQETLLRLLKRQENWQYSMTANWRINEFQTQTEQLPDNRLTMIAEPWGKNNFDVTYYSDNRVGVVRYRPDERRRFWNGDSERYDNLGRSGSVLRADSRHELQFLVPEIGPLKLTPFVALRGTAWDDSPWSEGSGGVQRGYFSYGLHGDLVASRVYDNVESELFDLHRMRHVINADFTAWNAHSNRSPDEMFPFESGVEDIDDFGGVRLGLRQRWQTKRGGPGRWRTVDWITLDLEAGFFTDKQRGEITHGDTIFQRPEDSISSNYVAANFQYRLSDSTVFIYDGVWDLNRDQMGTSNVSIAVEREPRLSYFVGWRYINDTDNSLLAFGSNYKLNEKHILAFREFYDLQEGRNFSTQVVYIRKWPRWYSAVSFDVDRSLEDVGINVSFWPEGAPRFGLGSKRYTGLADSVGLMLR